MKDISLDELVAQIETSKQPIILLLHGYAGVGKDTLAKWLVGKQQEEGKKKIKIVHVATGLKRMSEDVSQFIHDSFMIEFEKAGVEIEHERPSQDNFYNVDRKNERFYAFLYPDWTPRRCMQWLGTDVIRKYDPDFFIRYMIRDMKECEEKDGIQDVWIVADWRFRNERDWIRTHFGDRIIYDIHLTRETFTTNKGDGLMYQHRSEQDVSVDTIGYHLSVPFLKVI